MVKPKAWAQIWKTVIRQNKSVRVWEKADNKLFGFIFYSIYLSFIYRLLWTNTKKKSLDHAFYHSDSHLLHPDIAKLYNS